MDSLVKMRRKRLAARLRELREESGLSAAEVAARYDWTASKITWIETNRGKRPNPNDVRLLCDAYGVTDEAPREYLVQLARDGRKKGWWDPYSSALPNPYENYIGLEAEASTVLSFELGTMPGLLQTEDYARAVIKAPWSKLGVAEIDKSIEIRMQRQQTLRQEPPLRLFAVVDEAVLHRQVGGPAVMRAQLQHLIDVTEELPLVTIQVIPFEQGAHPSMTNGFGILEFPETVDPDVVYLENTVGGLWLEEPGEVAGMREQFEHLLGTAASARDTIKMIERALARYE
ncbi:MAG: helix-turn-helix domain-containing protein [Actinoallomurus sp.]